MRPRKKGNTNSSSQTAAFTEANATAKTRRREDARRKKDIFHTFTVRRPPIQCHENTKTRKHEDTKTRRHDEELDSMLRIPSPLSDEVEALIHDTIGCCIAVHRALGP